MSSTHPTEARGVPGAVTGARLPPGPPEAGSSAVTAEPVAWRRPELDLLRALVVVGLIVLHSALPFSSVDWYLHDTHTNVGFDIFILFGALWGMPLLFAVSGMGAWYALRSRSAKEFVRERTLRLFVPFVFGLLVVVPPMFYIGRVGTPGFDESYPHFWLRFFGDPPALVTGLLSQGWWASGADEFDVSHLYFLYVLLLLSLVALPLFVYLRRPDGARLVDRAAGVVERHPIMLLVAGALPMAAVEATLGPSSMTGSWARPAFAVPLLAGFVLASNRRFDTVLRRERREILVVALVATTALVFWTGALTASDVDPLAGEAPGWGALQGLAGWAWVLAILGFASWWAVRPGRPPATASASSGAHPATLLSRVSRYANQAVLPYYVLHHPVIVGAAWLVVRWEFALPVKYVVLVVVSFVVTVATYELLVRRFRVVRFLFGMKPRPLGTDARGPRRAATAIAPMGARPAAR